MKCIAESEHSLDRKRVCTRCGDYVPAASMLMTKLPHGTRARYAVPEDKSIPYVLTECSQCKLQQKIWMEDFFFTEVQLQAMLIGSSPTACCGAPMTTEACNDPNDLKKEPA